jgi:hypothetical protein
MGIKYTKHWSDFLITHIEQLELHLKYVGLLSKSELQEMSRL